LLLIGGGYFTFSNGLGGTGGNAKNYAYPKSQVYSNLIHIFVKNWVGSAISILLYREEFMSQKKDALAVSKTAIFIHK